MISQEAVLALPPPNGVIADQFFYIETAPGEQIVFSINDGQILYRGEKAPKKKPSTTRFPWEEPEETNQKPNKSQQGKPR